jgi:hypothetical protein
MTDNGGNDRRRTIEGRINTLSAGGNSASGRSTNRSQRSRNASADTETDSDDVGSGIGDDESQSADTDADALSTEVPDTGSGDDSEADADEAGVDDADETDEADASEEAGEDEASDDGPAETRAEDVDERSSLEVEMDRFVRAFAARRADKIGEDSLDEYIVGSVKGYLAGLLGGDVESPGTLKRAVEIEADDIFGGLLEAVADEGQDQDDVVIEAIAEAHDVPDDDSLVVAGLRDHEALLKGVVANNSNDLSDVSEVVQAAVETRLLEERAE